MLQSFAAPIVDPTFPFGGGQPRPPRLPYHRGRIYGNLCWRDESSLLLAVLLFPNGSMIFTPDVREVNRRRGEGEVEIGHCVRHDLRHREIAKPLVVRRDHVPRRLAGAGGVHRVLERLDVVVPQLPFGIIGFADLPVARRVIKALRETCELLLLADVEEEFEDRGPIFGEQCLEVADAPVARGPGRLVDELMDPRHEHVLVMRTVEDRDLAMPRGMRMHAPEEVMREFGGGGLLETGDARALRIEGAEDMIDRAVLPASVEGLQDDQDRVRMLGVEDSLLARELLAVVLRLLLRFGFRCVFAFVGRIELVQLDLGVRVDPKLFAVVHSFLLVPAGRRPSRLRRRLALTSGGARRRLQNQLAQSEYPEGRAAVPRGRRAPRPQ